MRARATDGFSATTTFMGPSSATPPRDRHEPQPVVDITRASTAAVRDVSVPGLYPIVHIDVECE